MTAVFRTYDQAALDAQYNNRAMVPNHPAHIARWAEESAEVRRRVPGRFDLAYGPDARERLDFFPAAAGAPLHVFIHGGYWRALDKSSFSYPAPHFRDAGLCYAALSYPLAPAARMEAIVESVRRALAWLQAHAAELGGDPGRISVSGHSAGGHLAAMLASSAEGASLAGVVPISGLYDLEPIRLSYLNDVLALDAPRAHAMSPVHHVPGGAAPMTLAVGAKESAEYHRQQDDFARAWRAAGNPMAAALDLDGHDHFSIVDDLARPQSALFAAICRHARRP